jgi:transposase
MAVSIVCHILMIRCTSQSELRCKACGYANHADVVAPLNLQERAFNQYRDIAGNCSETTSEKMRARFRKGSLNAKRSTFVEATP